MKTKRFCFLIVSFILSFAFFDLNAAFESYSQHLILPDQHPSPALKELLEAMDVNPEVNFSELVTITQRDWLRKSKERWEEEDRFNNKKEELYPILRKLGCVDPVDAQQQYYDYVIIMGATVNGIKPKVAQLIEEYNRGVRFGRVVFAAADWVHDLTLEIPNLFNFNYPHLPYKKNWIPPQSLPQTEFEIGCVLFDQIDFPAGLDPKDFLYISSGGLVDANNNPRRATTVENYKDFMKQADVEGKSCLVLSVQPYIGYQDATARSILPPTCRIETIGKGASKEFNYAVYMDSVARWIYQCQKVVSN